eukprot:123160-Prymnesium_polylepis.1
MHDTHADAVKHPPARRCAVCAVRPCVPAAWHTGTDSKVVGLGCRTWGFGGRRARRTQAPTAAGPCVDRSLGCRGASVLHRMSRPNDTSSTRTTSNGVARPETRS